MNINRSITPIQSELSLNGPRDSFIEDIHINYNLIKKRFNKGNIQFSSCFVGRRTKTKVFILSVPSITKPELVHNIQNQLKAIDIDGIFDSSSLKPFLHANSLFPTIMMSERPDKCSMALLEGKIVILVDNSPYALILPSFFFDFFHTTDDYYQKAFYTTFIRLIRFLAFLTTLYLPAIYIAVTTRNYSLAPFSLLMILKAGRTFVPFPAYLEALFMILSFEILKESDIRMSSTSGSAVSILGGLILGDAAVAAGIVSPIMIIVIAISSIAGLIFTSIELGNALRSYKLLFLFLASLFGIVGVGYGTYILLVHLLSAKSFGYSYLLWDKNEWKDSIIKIPTKVFKRNSKLTSNEIRGRNL